MKMQRKEVSQMHATIRKMRLAGRALIKPRSSHRQVIEDVKRLRGREGGLLMVHSSLSSLGFVSGGAAAVIDMLREALGTKGTLLVPTHSWLLVNKGLRRFDVNTTPTCVGAIPETFRKLTEAVRSLHPTHSVAAVGSRAKDITKNHEAAFTPCGADTPYSRLLAEDGDILLIGVGLSSNTAFHTIEALAGVDYLLQVEPSTFEIVNQERQARLIEFRCHAQNVPRRFPEQYGPLADAGALVKGKIGNAASLLIRGRRFMDVMNELIRHDPELLLQTKV